MASGTAGLPNLIGLLCDGNVQFVIVGGLAATIHGSPRATFDLDIVYSRKPGNVSRLVEVLRPVRPYLRGAPPGLPFAWDEATVRLGLNFTLTTSAGDIDLLGEIVGGGTYEQLVPDSLEVDVLGRRCRCLTLEKLIQVKRAAGRPKDLEVLAELQALLEERRQGGASPGT
jgi:hypothetical protein